MDAWNMMQGLDWLALPTVAELFGVEDIEPFIRQLITIRNYQNDRRN